MNGLVTDAKRIERIKGISSGFSKAIGQGCKAVIIDFDKHNVYMNYSDTSSAIANRCMDFIEGRIAECYIVKNRKYVKIKADIFKKYNDPLKKERYTLIGEINDAIKKALE